MRLNARDGVHDSSLPRNDNQFAIRNLQDDISNLRMEKERLSVFLLLGRLSSCSMQAMKRISRTDITVGVVPAPLAPPSDSGTVQTDVTLRCRRPRIESYDLQHIAYVI